MYVCMKDEEIGFIHVVSQQTLNCLIFRKGVPYFDGIWGEHISVGIEAWWGLGMTAHFSRITLKIVNQDGDFLI